MTHENKKIILAIVYRPPKLQVADDTTLYNEIQSLIQGRNAIVIDDFNCANVDRGLVIGDQEGKVRRHTLKQRVASVFISVTSTLKPVVGGSPLHRDTGPE